MSRILTVGAAQMGPIQRNDTRASAVARMIDLLETAARSNCDLVVFPELTLTTFFPRWFMTDQAEIDAFFESEMPSRDTAPLFDSLRTTRELEGLLARMAERHRGGLPPAALAPQRVLGIGSHRPVDPGCGMPSDAPAPCAAG